MGVGKIGINTGGVIKRVLDKDGKERTASYIAECEGHVEVLFKLWEWAREVLTTEELKYIFLDKYGKERTAWHIAAFEGHIELLHKLWEWAKRY